MGLDDSATVSVDVRVRGLMMLPRDAVEPMLERFASRSVRGREAEVRYEPLVASGRTEG